MTTESSYFEVKDHVFDVLRFSNFSHIIYVINIFTGVQSNSLFVFIAHLHDDCLCLILRIEKKPLAFSTNLIIILKIS